MLRQHAFAKIKHPPIVKAFKVTFHRYLPRTSTLILLVTFVGPATLSPSLSSLCLQVFRSKISSRHANMTSRAARKKQSKRQKRDATTAAAEANAHDTPESDIEATADDNTGRRAHGKKRSKTDKVAAAQTALNDDKEEEVDPEATAEADAVGGKKRKRKAKSGNKARPKKLNETELIERQSKCEYCL